MNVLDAILLLCFLPAVIQGLRKGLVKQIFSLAAVLVGIFVAMRFTPDVSGWASQHVEGGAKFVNALCFGVLLIAGALVTQLVGELITKIMNTVTLGWANRLLGVIFAIFKVLLLLGLLVHVFEAVNCKWELVKPETLDGSRVYVFLKDFAARLFPRIKELLENVNG